MFLFSSRKVMKAIKDVAIYLRTVMTHIAKFFSQLSSRMMWHLDFNFFLPLPLH